jgi:hypothetical protein
LVLSAKILITEHLLSEEMLARHSYVLHMIAIHLGETKKCDYLFHTASIYASIITTSSAMQSSQFWPDFLRAVKCYRDNFLRGELNEPESPLCKAVKADEVRWGNIDRALEALGHSDAAFTSDSHGPNDTRAVHRSLPCAHGQDLALSEGREFGGRTGDAGESPY